jgi:hypothetical protein
MGGELGMNYEELVYLSSKSLMSQDSNISFVNARFFFQNIASFHMLVGLFGSK